MSRLPSRTPTQLRRSRIAADQGVHLDPLLQGIVAFLDDHATLVEQVRQDLERGLKNPNTGRNGITPSQTLRSLTPHARQELGLSRTARTHQRWLYLARLYRL